MEFRKDDDAKGDFLVTIEDINAVRNNFGTSEVLGDANSDGVVNIHNLNEVRNHFNSVDFLNHGEFLVPGGDSSTLRLWDVRTRQKVAAADLKQGEVSLRALGD
ncbi:MAG: hypothetical protein SGJ19_09610 [Planctomycetia bacterium]|nr:hypothetical protein [Planctomycetia bacterium]